MLPRILSHEQAAIKGWFKKQELSLYRVTTVLTEGRVDQGQTELQKNPERVK